MVEDSTNSASTASPDQSKSKWNGFKIVIDNIDKNEKSRYSRIEKKKTTSHHMYGVQDRIDFSSLSDDKPTHPSNIIESSLSLLPSAADDHHIRRNFAIHISRVLAKHIPHFKVCFDDLITRHIEHDYHNQMEQKSHVVSESQS